jgi:2-succinyl-6-hydroxy-2,4-cyclohexadiene-1-carboxylate synthase
MTPLWDRLRELTMPATIVVGETDERFRGFGARLQKCLRGAQTVVVPGVGHGIPRDAPRELATILNDL